MELFSIRIQRTFQLVSTEIEVGHFLGIRAKAVFNRHFHVFDIYGTSIMSSMRPYKTERNEVLSTA